MNGQWKRTILVLHLAFAVATAAAASQQVSESHPVAAGARVEIECLAGTLTIEGWGGSEVEITGTLGDGVEGLDVESGKNRLSIEVDYDEDYHGRQQVATDLTLRVPAGSPVSVETVSASIAVSGLQAAVELESVSGAVRVTGSPESLDVETVSGAIDVERAGDGAELASVSGAIRVGSVTGEMEAENVSGTIVIEGGELTGGGFETVSGDITCNALPGGQGDIDMETMSGSITLRVDAARPAAFQLETFSGSIENGIGPEAQRTSKYTPEKQLRFNTGSGGPSIYLSSFSGSIKLIAR